MPAWLPIPPPPCRHCPLCRCWWPSCRRESLTIWCRKTWTACTCAPASHATAWPSCTATASPSAATRAVRHEGLWGARQLLQAAASSVSSVAGMVRWLSPHTHHVHHFPVPLPVGVGDVYLQYLFKRSSDSTGHYSRQTPPHLQARSTSATLRLRPWASSARGGAAARCVCRGPPGCRGATKGQLRDNRSIWRAGCTRPCLHDGVWGSHLPLLLPTAAARVRGCAAGPHPGLGGRAAGR